MKNKWLLVKEQFNKIRQKIMELEQETDFNRENAIRRAFLEEGRRAQNALLALVLVFMSVVSWKYMFAPELFKHDQGEKGYYVAAALAASVSPGTIFDRNGREVIPAVANGYMPWISDEINEAYGMILGTSTINYDGREVGFGILSGVSDYWLRTLDKEGNGCDITLTLDTDLQGRMMQLLNTEKLSTGNEGGCIIIQDNRTGQYLAFASKSSVPFDANNPNAIFAEGNPDGAGFIRGISETDPPGSIFKIIVAAAFVRYADQRGEALDDPKYVYMNTGEPDLYGVINFDHLEFGDSDIYDAIYHSMNKYFAYLGLQLGKDEVKAMMEDFRIGSDITIPFFADCRSSFKINKNTNLFAHTCYGQGKTVITPVTMLSAVQAIANDGVMLQPNIIKSITQGNKNYYTAEAEEIAHPLTAEQAAKVRELFSWVAFDKYKICDDFGAAWAKTGTAECGGGRVHTYLVGATADASFIISINDGRSSGDLYEAGAEVVQAINEYYGG